MLRRLADEVRLRKTAADAASKESGQAIAAAGKAHDHLHAALAVYRDLTIALTDGAGHDKSRPLPATTAAALAILDGS